MTERQYLAALSSFNYFGPMRTKLLLSYFGSAKKAWNSEVVSLREINLSEDIIGRFANFRKEFSLETYFRNLEKYSIKFVTIYEENYPQNLRGIADAPPVLYYKGTLKALKVNSLAIIGSRKMTGYGKEAAYKFSAELSSYGITIVSGLALGIDAVAHKACVDTGGKGVVVLASGLDTISPFTNKWIAEKLLEGGGAIVSEYPLGTPPFKTSFPSRNRIISGLSKGVIVIEGMRHSGTLLTANSAGEQGRTVFAVPGSVFSPLSEAPHFLIQNGAKLVNSVKDIIEELSLDLKANAEVVGKIAPTDDLEKSILEVLSKEVMHIDEITRHTNTSPNTISSKITLLELKGLVKSMGNGNYTLT